MKKFCLIFIFAISSFVSAEDFNSAINQIVAKTTQIKHAAKLCNINPDLLSAVILTERTLNYDWKDEALDIPLAKSGYNSSVGFCQVKLKTAYWIERTLDDSLSAFYPGRSYQNILPVSASVSKLISRLQNDSLNFLYAAAYLRIIMSFWEESGFPIDERPEISGTLYSIGPFLSDGKIRKPHGSPRPNFFGKKVKQNIKFFKK